MNMPARPHLVLALLAPVLACRATPRGSSGPAVDLVAAVDAAVAHGPGRAVGAKMKTKDGIVRFEVDVLAADGTVTEIDLHADGSPERRLPWDPAKAKEKPRLAAASAAATIDLKAAIETALGAVPGTAVEAELDPSDAGAAWKVEIRTAAGTTTKVKVDAATGQILG